jgi:SAM-dependent methyltransferase
MNFGSRYDLRMIFKFRRMRPMDPLQVAMTGVRMGERYLQVFCSDAALTGGLAMKTGLSGVAALAAPDAKQAARARDAASKAGALIDVQMTSPTTLPWAADAFDMVVIDNTAGDLAALAQTDRAALLLSVRQVLRPGGRVEIIERVNRAPGTESEELLRVAGFKPVRTLAEQDAFRFIEGLKG